MVKIFLNLALIFLYFGLGYLIKHLRLMDVSTAELSLKIVFYLNMPAVILLSVHDLPLSGEIFLLPLIAIIVHLFLGLLSYYTVYKMEIERKQAGVIVVGTLIMSTSFVVPFALIFYQELGVGLLLIFDLGNTLMALSLGYFFAIYYGSEENVRLTNVFRTFVIKLLSAPPFLALVAALSMNYFKVQIPHLVLPILEVLKFLFTPLIMIAIGMFFVPRILDLRSFVLAILFRTVGGLVIALALVNIFGLTGIARVIVIIGSSAPVGFVTVAFASLEDLDVKLAANIVSLSAAIGLILVPVFFLLF